MTLIFINKNNETITMQFRANALKKAYAAYDQAINQGCKVLSFISHNSHSPDMRDR